MFTNRLQFLHTPFILTGYDKYVLKKKGLVDNIVYIPSPFSREPFHWLSFPLSLFMLYWCKIERTAKEVLLI